MKLDTINNQRIKSSSATKLILIILDGFGFGPSYDGNAIYNSNTPVFFNLLAKYSALHLEASGNYVGLPKNQMGNSEVGHLTIGAGRILLQTLLRINSEIKNLKFFSNNSFLKAIRWAKSNNSKLHICGLASKGGVHSSILHLYALIQLAENYNVKTYLHLITDGRDTDKNSAIMEISKLVNFIEDNKYINTKIGSIGGRFFGMDRDKKFDRINAYINVLFRDEKSNSFNDILEYINESYENQIFDEFIIPAYNEEVDSSILQNDAFIMFNFRQDRAIELSASLTNNNYINNPKYFENTLFFSSMTKYSADVRGSVAYSFQKPVNFIGDCLSNSSLTQLRVAETEKYAHVTYFLDGRFDRKINNCSRIMVKSPQVKTYDLKPEMSLPKITKKILKNIDKYNVIITNFANADMVGHTGNLKATIEAVEHIDKALYEIQTICEEKNIICVITADHGNAEKMLNKDKSICKTHTNSRVPFCVISSKYILKRQFKVIPSLADVAPSILYMLDLPIPTEMTGNILVERITETQW